MEPANQSLAMVLVVRDEERFLEQHLKYHHALGVQKVYIFLDACQDDSPRIARQCDFAEVLQRPRRSDEAFMSVYQTRCLAEALQLARRDRFEWLLHVDPDEFCFGDDRGWLARTLARTLDFGKGGSGSLVRMLDRIPASIDQVRMHTWEVLPIREATGEPFFYHTVFQTKQVLTRHIMDPTTQQVVELKQWLGGRRGKSIIRSSADVVPGTAHEWRSSRGGALNSRWAGWYYHYVVVDGEHWWDKYRKFAAFPPHWEKGNPVRFPKQQWKEAAVRMTKNEAVEYFDRWVALPRREAETARGTVIDEFVKHQLGTLAENQ